MAQNFNIGKNEVSYDSDGNKLSALLFIPEGYAEGKKMPAVVFARPGTGVKEQTAATHAEALSKHGFITLAFDARGFGGSEGPHRQSENPYMVVEDIKNSVSFIHSLPCVDTDKIFNAGVCMGAGYAYYATALDARVKAVAMISPYLNAAQQNIEVFGTVENFRNMYLQGTSAARQKFFESGEDTLFPPVPNTQEQAEQPGMLPIAKGMMDYYLPGKPGGGDNAPSWKNEVNLYGAEALMTFSAFNVIHLMKNVPLFMALGDQAYTVDNSKEFFEKASQPKELQLIEGEGHFDLYWKPQYSTSIAEGIAAFFEKHGASA